MKIIVDMNLSPRWVDILSPAGIDTMHWSAIGAPTTPDTEILLYARNHDCIVLTCDLDFSTILAITQGEKPSVV